MANLPFSVYRVLNYQIFLVPNPLLEVPLVLKVWHLVEVIGHLVVLAPVILTGRTLTGKVVPKNRRTVYFSYTKYKCINSPSAQV